MYLVTSEGVERIGAPPAAEGRIVLFCGPYDRPVIAEGVVIDGKWRPFVAGPRVIEAENRLMIEWTLG